MIFDMNLFFHNKRKILFYEEQDKEEQFVFHFYSITPFTLQHSLIVSIKIKNGTRQSTVISNFLMSRL